MLGADRQLPHLNVLVRNGATERALPRKLEGLFQLEHTMKLIG